MTVLCEQEEKVSARLPTHIFFLVRQLCTRVHSIVTSIRFILKKKSAVLGLLNSGNLLEMFLYWMNEIKEVSASNFPSKYGLIYGNCH